MRDIIRVGDPTSHGGRVISGTSRMLVDGIPVARVGDACTCPMKGHNNCTIVEGNPNFLLDGIPVAFDGCKLSCGASAISTTERAGIDPLSNASCTPRAEKKALIAEEKEQRRQSKAKEEGNKMEGFLVTFYIYAKESDPRYAKDKKVKAAGLDGTYKEGFLYSNTGVRMQGTGVAESGDYITIAKSTKKPKDMVFKKGEGGATGHPVAWATIAVDPKVIPLGSRVKIDGIPGKIFKASDTGGAIKGKHIDVFMGPMNIKDAFKHPNISNATIWVLP